MTLLRVFDVPPPTTGGKPTPAVERAAKVTLGSDGDAAKREARALIEGAGGVLRSISWSPGPQGTPELVVYVSPKEG